MKDYPPDNMAFFINHCPRRLYLSRGLNARPRRNQADTLPTRPPLMAVSFVSRLRDSCSTARLNEHLPLRTWKTISLIITFVSASLLLTITV